MPACPICASSRSVKNGRIHNGGYSDRVWSMSFCPQGRMIASASFDTTVKLWQLDGTLLQTLQHRDVVNNVSFSPDVQMIASASNDKTVKLWSLDGTLWFSAQLPAVSHWIDR